MGLESVEAGQYLATVVSHGVREVERLDGALEAWVKLLLLDKEIPIEWKGLVMTRAGERNGKTFRCLNAVGCDGDLLKWLDAAPIDGRVKITIIDQPSKDGSKTYKTVDWLNEVGGGARKPSSSVLDKIKSLGLTSDKSEPVNDEDLGF